ncbi:MAG: carbohydrate ABC transporter permease [candidate division KSB1 bacterium]|nr:carbohydrate ABC transporter permease [candidate division KSB1 bacterium]MDZ7273523.1 carbohydrate ABC transporter permease [candidate division KSB1 bacterium]MDZ7286886.1 carbohydrate ABC transporter permease [candidate division KSB1 bacterium]MDZ7299761.1 carbohydrate ABC transporter permease [candidate division KSB1 bacterium]MDZ7308486.1 carbohydrate ABC transporter permease [candidate division KSB1 bacterium]
MHKILRYFVLSLAALVFIYPFLWMLSATLRPENEIGGLTLLPSQWTLANYAAVFQKIPLLRALANSLLVSLAVVASVLVFGSMTGFALARLHFRGRSLIFLLVLLTMILPVQLTLIPLYILMVKFGWLDTYLALIVPHGINALGVLMFRQAFKAIPQDVIDAARLDGAGEFGILFRIFWPLSLPTLITVAILTFMGIWNEVLWPMLTIRKSELMVMPQLVALFVTGGAAESQLGVQLAAATLLALPIVIAYAFFQKYFIASLAATGLKE